MLHPVTKDRERYPHLHEALESFQGSDGVIRAIDFFGIRSTASLDELMNEATGYLSRFFDSHFIADRDGVILFEAEAASTSGTEVDESQVETPDFASYVDIAELLRAESPRSDSPEAAGTGDGGNRGASVSPAAFRGRSFVQVLDVGDNIGLRVFVHPFILDRVAVSGGSGGSRADSAPSNAASASARPTFYLVGIVDDQEFQSAAIRLRLGWVTNATLALLGLLALTPLLWFWTAGDRVVIGRFALLGVCALPVASVVLFTVLACVWVTSHVDEHALDGAMRRVSDRIAVLFDRELSGEIHRLQVAVPGLLARDAREVPLPRRGGKMRPLKIAGSDERALTQLEQELYCDDADRNLDYDPARPEAWSAFLLGARGRQRVCLSEPRRARPARTPALDLQFRDYFEHPREGVLWRSPRPARPEPVECRIGAAQDRESLIPCLVDDLPEPSKRLFVVAGAPGPTRGGAVEAPYYLERIDAVVGGQVATTLAVNTGRTATPVAVAGVSLNALDRVVPPQHVHFAVVNRETGRTLFHSDDDLAMTTNFVEDAGRDPALWSLLRSGAHGIVDLVYTGVPVRAHVRPLRPGLPWTLVVYRGYELEDRVAGLTVALSVFFTLLCLVLTALVAGLALLVVRWCKPEGRAGIPATLGGVLAAGSRLWWCPIAVGVVLFLCSLWFSPHAWIPAGGRRVVPFFGVWSVLAVAALVVCCFYRAISERTGTRSDGDGGLTRKPDRSTVRRALGLVALITALAVVPPVLWFSHHRAALGVGLHHYLVDATLEAVDRGREEYRTDMLRRHGAGAAPAGDRMRRRWREESEPAESSIQKVLRSIVASSELAHQLMIYRTLPAAAAGDVPSLHDVFVDVFGYDIDRPPGLLSPPDFWRLLVVAMGGLFFALLIGGHAYSICAACTVVGRRRHGLVKLPNAKGELLRPTVGAPADRRLRSIVVSGSERCSKDFVDNDLRNFWRHDLRVKGPAEGYSPYKVDWAPQPVSATGEPLYVFGDLEDVLGHDAKGRALFNELERKVDEGAHVLIWSRVVPDYRYSDRFGHADRWFDRGRSDDEDRRDRWSSVARRFGSYVLEGLGVLEECERSVVDARARDAARFQGSATCFDKVWKESTREERLQLYALARGGVVDSRRTAALSSLVNREIVREHPGTGVVELRSEAFREFIEHEVDRSELDAWRKEGSGGGWRLVWPPLAIGGALGLAFLASANPEIRMTLLATLVGLLPAALPLLSRGSGTPSTES